ncbi:MAG: GW dipeptide domain-containing protein [Bacteroidetes bacterium]|nr:GW dipeptide domain-containing protein [Bacteroidota bacterium]
MKIFSRGQCLIILITVILISCQGGNDKKTPGLAPNAHQVKAEEVIQTSAYTYVRVSADSRDYWAAVAKMDITVGNTYYWSVGSEMRDFTSKELKRTFRSIFFIQDFSSEPILAENQVPANHQAGQMNQSGPAGKVPAIEHKGISVPKLAGGVTIAELYAGRKTFAGKTVKIRGEVVKFSPGIMDKNWVHLQDGSKDGENFDLTITTQDSVKVGETLVFEGKVILDKDFGAGYFYELLLEDAHLKK